MKTLILLALVPVVFCNTSDESRRQSAEMKALDGKSGDFEDASSNN